MLKEKTAPAECGLCPLPLDADDEEAALDREEEGVSPPVVSMTRCGTGGGRVYFTSGVLLEPIDASMMLLHHR